MAPVDSIPFGVRQVWDRTGTKSTHFTSVGCISKEYSKEYLRQKKAQAIWSSRDFLSTMLFLLFFLYTLDEAFQILTISIQDKVQTHAKKGGGRSLIEADFMELSEMPQNHALVLVLIELDSIRVFGSDVLILLRNSHNVGGEVSARVLVHSSLGCSTHRWLID